MTHPKLATPKSGWGGRGYKIPGREGTYPSVTTVLKQVAKPGLLQWIADQTAAFAVMNISYLMSHAEEVSWRFLRFYWSRDKELSGSAVRLYHESVKNDAADMGTNIHEIIQADLDGTIEPPAAYAIETDQMIEAWDHFFATHEIVSHRQEFTMVNDTIGVAGTADEDWTITCKHPAMQRADGSEGYCLDPVSPGPFRALVDLKSSRHTWPEHGYQLAGLAHGEAMMVEVTERTPGAMKHQKTEGGKKITTWWLEVAPPTWERYALVHIRPKDLDPKGNDMAPFCKIVDLTEDMDLYWMGFQGAMLLAKADKGLNERGRTRGTEE